MKHTLLCLVIVSSVAVAQNTNRASFAPLVGVTHYVIDGEATTGPTVGLQYFTRELSSSRFSLYGGVTFKPDGYDYYRADPFIYSDPTQPYRMQPPIYNGGMRVSRFSLGLAFFGFDWRTYLADGDVRPYLGAGAQFVGWSYSSTWTGTIVPDIKAGLDVHLTSGFSAFAEGQYAFGMPTLFGSRFSSLTELFSFGIGVNFAPRW